jgi:hypothetical protein
MAVPLRGPTVAAVVLRLKAEGGPQPFPFGLSYCGHAPHTTFMPAESADRGAWRIPP